MTVENSTDVQESAGITLKDGSGVENALKDSVTRLEKALADERRKNAALGKEVKALKRRLIALGFQLRMNLDAAHDALDRYSLDADKSL